MERVKNFKKDREESLRKIEKIFWSIWFIASVVGWWYYKPLLWGIALPCVRYMFVDAKKEIQEIQKNL